MEGMAEGAAAPSLPDLVLSLEQASFMAKQLSSTSNPAHLLQIYNSLHQANLNLSVFLSTPHYPQSLPIPPPSINDNLLSSATSAAFNDSGNEPMQVGDDEDADADADAEQNSKGTIEMVEEKMKDCFIKNKRVKRKLSPSAAAMAEERRVHRDNRFSATAKGFDPHVERLRALDLISQFHA
ncbi:uncharacterized protein LOC111806806 [Cucurbita pepo subsp. pepo]|uniref:uncharacterized protein LOC111806806 n=1 Tax=Cucurbita pepo subsp. pepo TaxID=3664 RepID=UPI000C9D7ECF|nr:uncharacterized protein LOC111806806 [Cucurbita pepo subsp. pepo]